MAIPSGSVAGSGWIKNTEHPGVKNFWFGDMHNLKGKDILNTLGLKEGDIDLVCGGPPCQGFKRQESVRLAIRVIRLFMNLLDSHGTTT